MGLRGIFFLSLFGIAIFAPLFNPFWGVLAYLAHYYVWPENQWWGQLLTEQGVRLSLTIGALTGASTLLHWHRIQRANQAGIVHSQEVMLCLLVGLMGLSTLYGVVPDPTYATVDLFDKMYKVTIFTLLMTHIVTSVRDLHRLMWFMYLVGGFYMGWEARNAPASPFHQGRLNILGGPDFSSSNLLASHFVAMGILGAGLIAISTKWSSKLLALFTGAFVANGVLMTQSRGAFVSMAAAGVSALFLANCQVRRWILLLLPLVIIGMLWLSNESYWDRISTVTKDAHDRDTSAQSRIDIWGGALRMFQDNPYGVGTGNFTTAIGNYAPEHVGRDAHNTYFRCLGELGVPGILLFGLLNLNAFLTLARCKRFATTIGLDEFCVDALAFELIIIANLAAGLTGTYLYIESNYVFLLLPVCLERALVNLPQTYLGDDHIAESASLEINSTDANDQMVFNEFRIRQID